MKGKPLYEYAREGIPLPQPIEARKVTIHSLELVEWKDASEHNYKWPSKQLAKEQLDAMDGVRKLISDAAVDAVPEVNPTTLEAPVVDADETPTPPIFMLKMRVSSGTYVRSIVHDLAHAVGSAGHVVTLTRTQQGEFSLGEGDAPGDCVPWEIFERAIEKRKNAIEAGDAVVDTPGEYEEWEQAILDKWHEE